MASKVSSAFKRKWTERRRDSSGRFAYDGGRKKKPRKGRRKRSESTGQTESVLDSLPAPTRRRLESLAKAKEPKEPKKPKETTKKPKTTKASKAPQYSKETQDFIDKGKNITTFALEGSTLSRVYRDKLEANNEIQALAEEFTKPGADKDALKSKYDAILQKTKRLEEQEFEEAERVMGSLREQLVSRSDFTNLTKDINIDSSSLAVATEDTLRKDAAEFFALSGGRGSKSLKSIMLDDDRAYANSTTGEVNIGRDHGGDIARKQTFFHELAHHIEFENPSIGRAAENFVLTKATGKEQKLSKLTGNKRYKDDEVAYPGKFVDPYVGKLYGGGKTEVVSMGLEHFTTPQGMYKLFKADPDHFNFILGIIGDGL